MNDSLAGIEIGGSKLQIVFGGGTGMIHERVRFAVAREEGAAGIRRQIEATLRQRIRVSGCRAVGVGFGGPVDWRTGRVWVSHHVEGWTGFELGRWLAELTGLPVRVDNDANVAALGEATCGAGSGRHPTLYVTLGSGVGGGVVVDGHIYHGATPGEVEIGHVRLDRSGATIEARCAGWSVDRRIREHIVNDPRGLLAQLVSDQRGGEARHLAEAVRRSDVSARRILDETTTDLAFGLSHAVHLLHPEVIVLGGGLALLGEPLRAGVEQALPGFVMDAFKPGPGVVLASLREDAVPVGALLLAGTATGKEPGRSV
jgi:glucokinase